MGRRLGDIKMNARAARERGALCGCLCPEPHQPIAL
jgi:hypothetical protein